MAGPDDYDHDDDRRRYPRKALSLLVQYRFNTFEEFLAEYSMNISLGGIFICTEDPKPEGSMVYLQFSLKDGSRLIEGMGKVVRVNPPGTRNTGMGIEFISFDDESMALISDICNARVARDQKN